MGCVFKVVPCKKLAELFFQFGESEREDPLLEEGLMGPNPYCLEKGVNSQDTMCFEGFKGHLPRPLVRRSPKSRRVGGGLGPHSGELLAALLRESSLT